MSEVEKIYRIVTANLLKEGGIVYLHEAPGGRPEWVAGITDADIFTDEEVAEKRRLAEGDERVVSVYTLEIAGRHAPLSMRERIRATGPTIKYGPAALAPDAPDYSI